MRDLRFRAWDEDRKQWHKGFMVLEDGRMMDKTTILMPPSRFILMQYTGLKDNTKWEQLTKKEQQGWIDKGETKETWNGKEIYEGDVVKYGDRNYKIAWDDEGSFFGVVYGYSIQGGLFGYTEIIGNICNNPDLLKGE